MTPKQARWAAITVTAGALAITAALALQPPGHIGRALWPAAVALVAIATTRQATVGLALGILAGGLLLVGGDPIRAIRELLAAHLFPAVQGPWRIAAIGFTLVMGAFAGLLEHSGGFESLLRRILGDGQGGRRRLLLGVYGVGLLCFFDGLASAMLTGRLARPLVDRARIAREKLAWIVDSTSSPVACISLVSTWIATQLSLIVQGLQGAPFPLAPYELYLGSILANPYCLLTLLLIPLAIAWDYEP
ncbi:MAG: hypothetical protein VKP62_14750, partial [Candidatus Sericytochromatia bacterium]|nr:hypothetical protein [Candidatus Sericytochromatia bacterium]